MFDFFKKTEQLPRDIKNSLKPREEFSEQTKTAFLAVFDATSSAAGRVHAAHGFSIIAKSLIACGALIAVFASVSVYADTANVAADSPLYPLKRLDESVQLAVVPTAEKAQLQANFATLRANEISDLEKRKPSSTIIVGLSNDLNTSLDASLNDVQGAKLSDGMLANVCDKVLSAMMVSTSSVGLLNIHGNIIGRFMSQCGDKVATSTHPYNSHQGERDSGNDDGGGFYRLFPGLTASTTLSVSSTVSSTASSTRPHRPFLRL